MPGQVKIAPSSCSNEKGARERAVASSGSLNDEPPDLASESETDSDQSTCPEADTTYAREKPAPGSLDPVLGVRLPLGSSRKDKDLAQAAHLEAAKSQADGLTPSLKPLPRLADIASHVAALGPSDVRRLRRKRIAAVRTLARSLRKQSDDLITRADPHVASVLRAAGPGGVHVAVIERLLVDIGYADAKTLVADLLSGFELIGEVAIAPETDECTVRDFECSEDHVDRSAEKLAGIFVAQQSAPPADEREKELRREIFRQTVEDQKPPCPHWPISSTSG